MAHLHSAGVYEFGVRVVLADGREAIWDADGAAGLEATIMRDNVLVGMVPTIPGSESYADEAVVAAIAGSGDGAWSSPRARSAGSARGTGRRPAPPRPASWARRRRVRSASRRSGPHAGRATRAQPGARPAWLRR